MFLASGLSVGGRGGLQGQEPGGDRQEPRAPPWDCGVPQEVDQQKGPRLGGRADASCLADSLGSPDLFLFNCVPLTPKKAQPPSLRLHLLLAQYPHPISKCPQDSWALLHRTLFSRTLPQAKVGTGKGHHAPHTKEGGWPGAGGTGSLLSGLAAAAPAFPKQQAPPGWGPT